MQYLWAIDRLHEQDPLPNVLCIIQFLESLTNRDVEIISISEIDIGGEVYGVGSKVQGILCNS